mmetsp:Transcript_22921/g.77370  ORF Transcript_22921/g.77370 Transcript_22921/m.77370 type:complete len:275 (+) Transcript_22921:763-1587(+)
MARSASSIRSSIYVSICEQRMRLAASGGKCAGSWLTRSLSHLIASPIASDFGRQSCRCAICSLIRPSSSRERALPAGQRKSCATACSARSMATTRALVPERRPSAICSPAHWTAGWMSRPIAAGETAASRSYWTRCEKRGTCFVASAAFASSTPPAFEGFPPVLVPVPPPALRPAPPPPPLPPPVTPPPPPPLPPPPCEPPPPAPAPPPTATPPPPPALAAAPPPPPPPPQSARARRCPACADGPAEGSLRQSGALALDAPALWRRRGCRSRRP